MDESTKRPLNEFLDSARIEGIPRERSRLRLSIECLVFGTQGPAFAVSLRCYATRPSKNYSCGCGMLWKTN